MIRGLRDFAQRAGTRPNGPRRPWDDQPVSVDGARVVLYGKPGCHLCDDARTVVAQVCARLGVRWSEVDITTDERLLRDLAEQIPVTFVDGRQHDFWTVDAERLRTALALPPAAT
jgi:glutaredoxin